MGSGVHGSPVENSPRPLPVVVRLVAIGFSLGAAEHLAGAVLLFFGVPLFPPPYPAWRHAVMSLADAGIVWIAVKRPALLIPALVAFLVEQLVVNGPFVWREAAAGRAAWGAIVTIGFVVAALALLRRGRPQTFKTDM